VTSTPEEIRARTKALFDQVAGEYDQSDVPFFGPIAAGLCAALDPRPGERVADVGAGRGALTVPLAAAVGPGGRVDAVDLSPGMLAHLRDATSGLEQVRVHEGDASALPEPPYDAVAASLVLFFLPDPGGTLAAWREALRDGGRVGAATFLPWADRWDALEQATRARAQDGGTGPNPFAAVEPWDSDDSVAALFSAAGLRDVTTSHLVHQVALRDAAQLKRWALGTAARALWVRVPPERHEELEAAFDDLLDDWRDDDGLVRLDVGVRYTLGRR
jgi:SAM-dependent methyltransferase